MLVAGEGHEDGDLSTQGGGGGGRPVVATTELGSTGSEIVVSGEQKMAAVKVPVRGHCYSFILDLKNTTMPGPTVKKRYFVKPTTIFSHLINL